MTIDAHISGSVRVLLFAGLRDRAGRGELTFRADEAPTVDALAAALERQMPGLLSGIKVAVAVNGRYERNGARELAAGDEVAFLPPVSGG
ncbi:MAG: MoaD/ThiS family protein [Planctomycetes bacterium]|nr:MoaD/ThiS family protein [Planctomycetota bacterium]